MPMYDYKCPKCGETFEKNVPLKDYRKSQKCPKCGHAAKKLISCAALKGVG